MSVTIISCVDVCPCIEQDLHSFSTTISWTWEPLVRVLDIRCKCHQSECLRICQQSECLHLSEVNFTLSATSPAAKWRGELFLPAVSLAFTFCGVTNSLTYEKSVQ